jgi:hypothetical protein
LGQVIARASLVILSAGGLAAAAPENNIAAATAAHAALMKVAMDQFSGWTVRFTKVAISVSRVTGRSRIGDGRVAAFQLRREANSPLGRGQSI